MNIATAMGNIATTQGNNTATWGNIAEAARELNSLEMPTLMAFPLQYRPAESGKWPSR